MSLELFGQTYTEASLHGALVWVWVGIAVAVFVSLFFVSAPYGRHARPGWGPTLPFFWGWIGMEITAVVGMPLWFALGERAQDPVAWVFLGLWELHYVQRTFVYAWLRRERGKPIPLSVVLMALVFNFGNTYLIGRYLFTFADPYGTSWLFDPRFLLGASLFLAGWLANLHSDTLLLRLRRPGERGYRIPTGGLYRWISCPNYASEIVEWLGYALLTFSAPALAFAIWTAANLAPRAYAHHRWYRDHFSEYPPERRALVPHLW